MLTLQQACDTCEGVFDASRHDRVVDLTAQAVKGFDETPRDHPFDLKCRKVEKTLWGTCSQVLSASAMEEDLRRGGRG